MTGSADEAYYRQLVEHIGAAVIATDAKFDIRTWNSAASRMFGAASGQMIGTPALSIVPQERRGSAERMLKRVLQTGETDQLEFQHRGSQGSLRELSGTIAPLVSETGERIGVSLCLRDITRRIELQTELDDRAKMASLGELAGAISHYFNNTLGGIITSIDYATASGDPRVKGRVLEQAGWALSRAMTLLNGLLAFAEGDPRADDLADFTEIINELAHEIEERLQGSLIEFTLNMPNLPVLPVGHRQVLTVLRNITQNAIEAMPDGGTLQIDVFLEAQSLLILISDTGVGLDDAAKSRIFEPLWSTKGGMATGSTKVAGLGLAIAHGLVQMLGGSITVTSEPGKGSCFRVVLPRPEET